MSSGNRSDVTRALHARPDLTERDASAILAEALALELHRPGARERHRALLERALELSGEVLAVTVEPQTIAGARLTQVLAHSARARDARHGASQLSQGSQRAPTREDCEDGWRRVEAIVATAEASAREAARVAIELDDRRADDAARAAEVAARDARKIIDERNHAYTFHTDPGFSFGEGWYVAAAALLAEVEVQIEPDKPQTAQAERFLRDAGLGARIVPYRSRPRANKALPDLIARAFVNDPCSSQNRLRAAFLGDEPIPSAIEDFADRALASGDAKVLLWVRQGVHHPTRSSTRAELVELSRLALESALTPVLVGDALPEPMEAPNGAIDMTLFWRAPLFQGDDMRRAQLQLFEHLKKKHGLVGQLGVTTAGMDGPALMGLPTMYLTREPNVRMSRWVGAVPGYEEVVRDEEYLERISRTLTRWASEDARRLAEDDTRRVVR